MVVVSVVMSSYNHEKYISEAIESVLNQTYKDFELIIVDDCSKDNSRRLIRDYQLKDKRIRTIFHKENHGMARTMNDGINEAKGKFVAMIDSDDVWVSAKLEKQLDILKLNEDLIVWSEGEIIDTESRPTGVTFTQRHKALTRKKSGDIFEELLYGNLISKSSIIFNLENARDIKFDEHMKYLNDYRFMVDLAEKYKFCFIREPLTKYRLHGSNSVFSDLQGWQRDAIIIGEYLMRKYGHQIPKKATANIYLRTGLAYSRLGEKIIGRQLVLRAVNLDPLGKDNVVSLAQIAGNGDSFPDKIVSKSFYALDLLLILFRKTLASAHL
jgi:glycosyltransferase involved in cell wall biosynthesis